MSSLKKGFLTFGSWTMLSRVVGFVRDLLTAMVLGAGPLADAFIVAQRLPNLFRNLFAEGALSAAFVPLFTKERAENGDEAARKFVNEANAVLCSTLFFFVALMIIFMPWVIRVIAPGFHDEPEKFALTVSLAQIAFPYLLLISLSALQGGVLNALGKLGPYAAAPVLYNIIQIVTLLWLVPNAEAFHSDIGHILAWSVTTAGVGQAILLGWYCRRAGFPVNMVRLPRITPGVRVFLRRLGPGVLGAGAAQINLAISTVLASLLPTGAVAYLYYADRLNQLPLGVIGVAISMALLPLLAQAVQEKSPNRIESAFSRAIDIGMLFGLPAAAALAVLGTAIFEVLFVRGAFTSADAAATARVLQGYALGIPAFILVKIFATRFFAGHDTRTPVRIALVALSANIAFAVWLLPPFGAFGIAMAASLASWVNLLLLAWRLNQAKQLTLDTACRRRLPRIILAVVVMGLALMAGLQYALPWTQNQSTLVEATALAVIVAVGGGVYALCLLLTRTFTLAELRSAFAKKSDLKPIPNNPD